MEVETVTIINSFELDEEIKTKFNSNWQHGDTAATLESSNDTFHRFVSKYVVEDAEEEVNEWNAVRVYLGKLIKEGVFKTELIFVEVSW